MTAAVIWGKSATMTNDDTGILDRIVDDESRRSFMKKSALTTAATGLAASGTVAAQEDGGNEEDDDDDIQNNQRIPVSLFQNDFRGGARFMLTSSVIEYSPNVPQNIGGTHTGYNTHMATYLNTAERFPIFVAQSVNLDASYNEDTGWFVDDADQGSIQPAVYELQNEFSFYEETDQIVTAHAYTLEEDVEDNIFNAEGLNSEEEINDFLF